MTKEFKFNLGEKVRHITASSYGSNNLVIIGRAFVEERTGITETYFVSSWGIEKCNRQMMQVDELKSVDATMMPYKPKKIKGKDEENE